MRRGTGDTSGRTAESAATAPTTGIISGSEKTKPVTSASASSPWSKRGRGGVDAVTGRGPTRGANCRQWERMCHGPAQTGGSDDGDERESAGTQRRPRRSPAHAPRGPSYGRKGSQWLLARLSLTAGSSRG